ncbi:LOW QUALITY PROTEIN: 2-aminoethylphosphonate ABC transporter ATP-binding component PhnT, partial [Rhodococcus opacus PD630]
MVFTAPSPMAAVVSPETRNNRGDAGVADKTRRCVETVRQRAGGAWCRPGHRRRRVHGSSRTERVREVDAAASDRRTREPVVGPHPIGRERHHQDTTATAGRCDGLPKLCSVPAPDRREEYRLPSACPQDVEGRDPRTDHDRGVGARSAKPSGPAPGPAFRWATSAGGPGPGDGPRPGGVPHGRAAVESRCRVAQRDPHRAHRPAPSPEIDVPLRHPRPGRGDDDGDTNRTAEQRKDRAGRYTDRAVRHSAIDVRRRLPRRATDEPVRGNSDRPGRGTPPRRRRRRRTPRAVRRLGDRTTEGDRRHPAGTHPAERHRCPTPRCRHRIGEPGQRRDPARHRGRHRHSRPRSAPGSRPGRRRRRAECRSRRHSTLRPRDRPPAGLARSSRARGISTRCLAVGGMSTGMFTSPAHTRTTGV